MHVFVDTDLGTTSFTKTTELLLFAYRLQTIYYICFVVLMLLWWYLV